MNLTRMLEIWSNNPMLRKAIFLHVPILLSIYVLTDNDSQNLSTRHLAVFTALSRHPPSMRVFRGIFVICLLGICSSMVLGFLEIVIERDLLDRLFFSAPYTLVDESLIGDDGQGGYELTDIEEDSCIEEDDTSDNDDVEEEKLTSKGTKRLDQQNTTVRSPAGIIGNMSLDLLLYILVALFLFTISSSGGGQYVDQNADNRIFQKLGNIAAPIFPLILFFFCAAKSIFPWTKRKRYFWTVVAYTLGAPLYDVQFRDGFVGDIFTSMVRPMQDIVFTSIYLLSGLQGWWIYRDQTSEDQLNLPVEKSWLLHTMLLPACTVSPLFWRFCQCLRQCYDTKKRWPYLGNAAKYFFAAQVAMFGVFDPQKTGSAIWILAFVCATLYQLWWDVFMDWELLEWTPGSGVLGGSFQLRKKRLFRHKSLYMSIFTVNFILRFGWTLIVMPSRYLSPGGVLLDTFSADFSTLIIPTLACAEVIRRSLWGIIRVELEVINLTKREDAANFDPMGDEQLSSGNHMKPMNVESLEGTGARGRLGGTMLPVGSNLKGSANVIFINDMSSTNDVQVLWELCIYATAFMSMGIVAAVHRNVM